MTRTSLYVLLLMAVVSGAAFAQCSGFHQTTSLTINGIDPATDPGNQIALSAPYAMALDVADSGGAALPLIILAGNNITCGALPATPTLSVDIGGASVLLDGTGSGLGIPALNALAVTPFTISTAFPTAIWQGLNGPAFQAIVLDPTAGAVPFISTTAGQLVFQNSTTTCYTLADDGNTSHALGGSINFGGVPYSTLYVGSNGQVTFGSGVNDFSQTLAEHFGGWGAPVNAGVSLLYTDLNNGGTASGATYCVTENLLTGDVDVDYNNQNYWGSNEAAGSFKVTFSGPLVMLDYTNLVAQVTGTSNFIIGVTDGDPAVGTDTDLTVANGGPGLIPSLGIFTSAAAGDSVAEDFVAADAALLAALPVVTFIDLGAFMWTVF